MVIRCVYDPAENVHVLYLIHGSLERRDACFPRPVLVNTGLQNYHTAIYDDREDMVRVKVA